jgi:hypothetical protein
MRYQCDSFYLSLRSQCFGFLGLLLCVCPVGLHAQSASLQQPASGATVFAGQPVVYSMYAYEPDNWISTNDYLILEISPYAYQYPWNNACNVQYQPATNRVYLTLDSGSQWASGLVGSGGILTNSQCSVNTSAGTVSRSGGSLWLTLPITFTGSYTGTQYQSLGLYEGYFTWFNFGFVTVQPAQQPPTANLTQPANGAVVNAGQTVTYSLYGYEPDNWASTNDYLILDVSSVAGSQPWNSSCNVQYQPATNTVFLTLDSGSAWSSGSPGSGLMLANSQCSVSLAQASVFRNGGSVTLNLPITFTGNYTGTKYNYVALYEGSFSWYYFGTITIQPVQQTATVQGQVTLNGSGLAGVTVSVTRDGSQVASTLTDAGGNYAVSVLSGYTYTVALFKAGYTFSPPSGTFTSITGAVAFYAQAAAQAAPTVTFVNTGSFHGGMSNLYVGDTYRLTITGGPPNQPVTVNEVRDGNVINGVPVGTSDANGGFVLNGTVGYTDAGVWSEQWFVGGIAATPTLSFTVIPLTCQGPMTTSLSPGTNGGANDPPIAGGTTIGMSMTMPGATGASFEVNGAITNPYNAILQGINPNPMTYPWSANINTAGMGLGEYKVKATAINNGHTGVCTDVGLFNIGANTPNPPGQAKCASMTGVWLDRVGGQPNISWSLTDLNGNLSGFARAAGSIDGCNFDITWSTLSGSYSSQNQAYQLTATNPSPTSSCGRQASTFVSTTGNLSTAPYCGLGAGTASSQSIVNLSNTLTVSERIPIGETTTFSGWYDAYGFPTVSRFDMRLDSIPSFAGRQVQEVIPSPAETPAGFEGVDGCYWPAAPWPANEFTKLAVQAVWFVQNQNGASVYGPDKVGFLPNTVAFIQQYAPALRSPGSSCVIRYPQKMRINVENVVGITNETYGGPNTGFNLLQFTFTPTSVLVTRAGVGDSSQKQFHF